MGAGLSIAPLSLSMFAVALIAGRRGGKRRPASLIRAGFLLLTIGLIAVEPIVPRATSGWYLAVPLIIAGSGLGLMVSQLNNYTLAPISEERVSEAAGVNSAGGSFGLSFGLAFAGAILLATLSFDEDGGDQQSGRRVRTLPARQGPLPSMEGALLLTDLPPARLCAWSAGSGSGRPGAIDGEVPVTAREIQRRDNQEEGCPSVDAVREAYEARGGLDTATANARDPEAAEVAVLKWPDQALQAGPRGRCPPPAQAFRKGVVVLCVHRVPPVALSVRPLRPPIKEISL
jgi:hypothetical protein